MCSLLYLIEVTNPTTKIVLAIVAFLIGFIIGFVYFYFEKTAAIGETFKSSADLFQKTTLNVLTLPFDYKILNE